MCDSAAFGEGCSSSQGAARRAAAPAAKDTATCMKCRQRPTQVMARQHEPLCYECLATQLESKTAGVVRLRGLIAAGDAVALAFSGGTASAALLCFLAGLRNPRTDRLERRKIAFTLDIIHIDESAAWGAPAEAAAAARSAVERAVQPYLCEGVRFHSLPLEGAFAAEDPDPEGQRQRLQRLFQGVSDATGREDLLLHLRTHSLLAAARRLGCGKLARGDCATRLAAHVVAAAAKGCGYGLPGDVHLVDARLGPSQPLLFYPLREVGRKELEAFCQHKQLPVVPESATAAAAAAPGLGPTGRGSGGGDASINALAAAFVETLAAHNPGSTPNILGTMTKLQAFPWNVPPEVQKRQAGDGRQQQQPPPPPQQQQQQLEQAGGAVAQLSAQPLPRELLCPLCLAPLADDELAAAVAAAPSSAPSGLSSAAASTPPPCVAGGAAPLLACCFSCGSQILGLSPGGAGPASDDSSSKGSAVAGLLPEQVQHQMRRLAAAEHRAAEAGGAAEHADGAHSRGSAAAAAATERLRLQIAEFLLDD